MAGSDNPSKTGVTQTSGTTTSSTSSSTSPTPNERPSSHRFVSSDSLDERLDNPTKNMKPLGEFGKGIGKPHLVKEDNDLDKVPAKGLGFMPP